MTREVRPTELYYEIQLHEGVNVFLTDDTTFDVTVETGAGLLPRVVTECREGILTIRNENRCNWVRRYDVPLNVYVSARALRHLFHYGWGHVATTAPWRADYMGLVNYGAGSMDLDIYPRRFVRLDLNALGDVRLRGAAPRGEFIVQDVGALHAFALDLEVCRINSTAPVATEVSGRDSLQAFISGSGDVYYAGQPNHVALTRTGSGRLIER